MLQDRIAEAITTIIVSVVEHKCLVSAVDNSWIGLHPRVPTRRRNFNADLLVLPRPQDAVRGFSISEAVALIFGPRPVEHLVETAVLDDVRTAYPVLAVAHVNAHSIVVA